MALSYSTRISDEKDVHLQKEQSELSSAHNSSATPSQQATQRRRYLSILSVKKKKLINQVLGYFDRSSPPTRPPFHNLIRLGEIEETDTLGVTLHREAISGNRRALKKVLNSAILVDYPNDMGQTPLFCACARDSEPTAIMLLQYGANPNEKSQDGMTPCHAACYVGNIRLLGKLIEAGGDLRLHDNAGNSMRDWTLQNSDVKKQKKMLEFLDQTHVYAMAYSGDTIDVQKFTKYAQTRRPYQKTSLMEIMKMRTGSDSSFENLRRVQSMGFGKVYLGNDRQGGIVSVVPLIPEAVLTYSEDARFLTGFGTYIEEMKWINWPVSVKQVKPDAELETGIDLLIADAEYLGKLRHPNILLLMGICQSVQLDRLMLVLERVENATLHHLLHFTNYRFHDTHTIRIIHQVCAAMDFIQGQNLIHCGLSSLAVYLVSAHVTKVGNFEFMVESVKADFGKPSRVSLTEHGAFLSNWMAPELLRGEAPCFASDIFSFCCIIWEMFSREVPWEGKEPEDIKKLVADQGKSLSSNLVRLPSKLRAICAFGLEPKQEDRLNRFSLITNWLNSDQTPKMRRAANFRNKSSNFAEQTVTSSPSASQVSSEQAERFVLPATNDDDHDDSEVPQGADSTMSLCGSSSSSSSFEQSETPKPVGRFHLSPSYISDMMRFSRKSVGYRKSPSEGDLQHLVDNFGLGPSPMKPASHIDHLLFVDQPHPHDISELQLQERNNNGWPYSWGKSTTLPRDFDMQSERRNQDHTGELDSSCESFKVRRLAESFEQRLDQHKLRQAILKGSMAPRGSCPELDTSSDSMRSGGRCVGEEHQSTKSLLKDCSDNKSTPEARRECDTADLSSTPLLKSSSTPKISKVDKEVASHLKHIDSNLLEYFYPSKILRDVGTNSEERKEKESDGENTLHPRLVEDRRKRFGEKFSREDMERKSRREALSSLVGTGKYGGKSGRHRLFLDELREAHARIARRSIGTDDPESSPGILYHSPTIQFYTSDKEKSHGDFSPLARPKAMASKASQLEDDRTRIQAAPNTPSPLIKSSQAISKGKCGLKTPYQTPANTREDDSFWIVTPMFDVNEGGENISNDKTLPDTKNHITSEFEKIAPAMTDVMDSTSMADHKYQNMEHECFDPRDPHCGGEFSSAETMKGRKAYTLAHQGTELSSLSQREGSKQGIDSTEDGNGDKAVLDSTFTIAPGCRSSVVFTSPTLDSSVSVDSDKVGQWVDHELGKIRSKLNQSSDKSDLHTDPSNGSSPYGLKDISPSSTIEDDPNQSEGDKGEDECITREDSISEEGYQKLSKYAEKGSDAGNLLKIESAKSVSEVDGCDFEFREFYIDDDFDSTEHIQHDIPCRQAPLLDCNVSTRHVSDTGDSTELATLSVKERAAFFSATFISVKPPVFPRKPKRSVQDNCIIQGNVSQSASSPDNVEEGTSRTVLRESVSERNTLERNGEGLRSLKVKQRLQKAGLTPKGREGVPMKPRHTVETDLLRYGKSEPSINTTLRSDGAESKSCDHSKGCDHKDEDDTLCQVETALDGDADENTLMLNEENFNDCVDGLVTAETSSRQHANAVDTADTRSCMTTGKAPDTVVITEGCQTSFEDQTMKTYGRGDSIQFKGTHSRHDSDSDSMESDQWVKNKLKCVQEKIQMRKKRLEEEDSLDSCDKPIHIDERWLSESGYGVAGGPQEDDEDYTTERSDYLGQKCDKTGFERPLKYEIMNDGHDLLHKSVKKKDSRYRQDREVSMSYSESLRVSKHKMYESRHHGCKSYSDQSYIQGQNDADAESSEREHNLCKTGDVSAGIQQVTPKPRSQAFNSKGSHKGKHISKLPQVVSADRSYRAVALSNSKEISNYDEHGESSKRWKPFRSEVQRVSSPGLEKHFEHGSNREAKKSILRRPNSGMAVSEQNAGSAVDVASSSHRSKPKISASRTSRSTEKMISFQDEMESKDTSPNRHSKFATSSKQIHHAKEELPKLHNSFVSTMEECDGGIVETWLERQNFAERCSVGSSWQVDHQSITSKVMELQNMAAGQQNTGKAQSKNKLASVSSDDEPTLVPQSSSSSSDMNQEYSHTKKSKTSARQDSKHEARNTSLLPLPDGKKTFEQIKKPKARPAFDSHDGSMLRGNNIQSRPQRSSPHMTSQDQRSQRMHRSSVTKTDECCLTLDLTTPTNARTTETRNENKPERTQGGLHRFYIPREIWPEGCQAKLNVQISPTHPNSHRVTTTATDSTSGRTEILLDQTIITSKLRSIIQID